MMRGRQDDSDGNVVRISKPVRWLLAFATAVSFLLVVHNYVLNVLPDRRVSIESHEIQPYSNAETLAYVFKFDGSEPDRWPSVRSRVNFFEGSRRYTIRARVVDEVTLTGGDRFMHQPGRIVFATTDNTNPHTNGRKYSLTTPVLYDSAIGEPAMLLLLCCAAAWFRLTRPNEVRPGAPGTSVIRWRWHLAGATMLFLFGLYCNTGTLAPYANTCAPMVVAQDSGYAYNQDHPHFRVLFDFVDGRDRLVWDHALLLRRILFPVLGWPLMRLFGFEMGGTLTSLALNTAALLASLILLRRWIGEKGAIFAGWTMALYPGAAYWAGMPYPYAMIVPGSLLLTLGLWKIVDTTSGWRLTGISLAMGLVYLGYDFAAFFVPATLIALCWRRRFAAAASSAALQLAPIVLWLFALARFFGQPLLNPNSGPYRLIILSYLHPPDFAGWWQELIHAPDVGFDIFFAANFLFFPALFLFVLVANPFTSRIRFNITETALLASSLALFLVINLSPDFAGGWDMRGTWISRIYQPVFPALLFFMARWWQDLPSLPRLWNALIVCALVFSALGNAMVVFGPILGNPGHISEAAFYRFYDHTDAHATYESTLRTLGRRPLGFTRRQKAPHPTPTATEKKAEDERAFAERMQTLRNLRFATKANQSTLAENQSEYRIVGRALAEIRSLLLSKRMEQRVARGEITADEARRAARPWQDFASPSLRAMLDKPVDDAPAVLLTPEPQEQLAVENAIKAETVKVVALQRAIERLQDEIVHAQSALAQVRDELSALEKNPATPNRP